MNRLTKVIGGHVVFPPELVGALTPDNDIVCSLLTRLAAYEDTGLEPEEIAAAENLRHDCKIECLLKQYNELSDMVKELGGIDHLRDLAQAERDGRLVVLPCKGYTFTARGDIVRNIIFTNCRKAKEEAEAALEADG